MIGVIRKSEQKKSKGKRMTSIELLNGDCLELMKNIKDQSVDMILCDLPYGTTACKWDTVIPFEPLWEQYERIIKKNGVIVLFGSEPFSSKLRMSNLKLFKYDWIWQKSKSQHFAQAPYRPMTEHETISVFSNGGTAKNAKIRMVYNPQGTVDCNIKCKGKKANHSAHRMRKSDQQEYVQTKTNYPKTIIQFKSCGKPIHPTQKPVALLEYLIKTYTQENELVLDNCMGSGSTGIACLNTNRRFIGMELDEEYFSIAENRIEKHQCQLTLFKAN
jgi:site-specific DNA-methyltransferase (adenine-specific)